MTDENNEYEKLRWLHKSAKLIREGDNPVVLLPQFAFRSDKHDVRMDLLLHPAAHSGYPTRLFFERKLKEWVGNWSQHYVVDRQWWARSWKDIGTDMEWPSMLCAHLRAVE